MRVYTKRTLRLFWERHEDSGEPLQTWLAEAEQARWSSPHSIKDRYASASILANSRICFNIKGKSYRLIVAIAYNSGVVLIKWIGTHAEYDRIDADTVGGL